MMIRRFKSRIGDRLRQFRWSIRFRRYAEAHRFWRRWEGVPECLDLPPGRRVMVLAPHMDDEVIGCGGTLRKCVLAGKRVAVVYLTDGRQGDQDLASLDERERVQRQQGLVQTRKSEARRACEVLGISELLFLDGVDGRLQSTPEMRGAVAALIAEFQPDTLFVPHFLEDHTDHRETARVLVEATAGRSFPCDCYAYEVWTALYPNCVIDISSVVETKRQALLCYESQLKGNNYVRTSLGLNAYRSMIGNGEGYGEAFWRAPLEAFRARFTECERGSP